MDEFSGYRLWVKLILSLGLQRSKGSGEQVKRYQYLGRGRYLAVSEEMKEVI